jgi:hypothetical protein
MRIEAEIDEVHAQKLAELQKRLTLDIATVISRAIDAYYEKDVNYGSRLLTVFQEEGLIGSLKGDGTLSETYKEHLNFEERYDNRG